ncbi:MAG: Holliday junction resolvase RuvX [Candidatus Paceibacterota bacterium]
MRFLGIDYGTVRIGVSLSDEGGEIAFPYGVYPNNKEVLKIVNALVEKEQVREIIIGESRNFQGEENVVMKKVKRFKEKLERALALPVHLEPEFLTTVQAKHFEKKGMRDASAAALILQSFLDKQKNDTSL